MSALILGPQRHRLFTVDGLPRPAALGAVVVLEGTTYGDQAPPAPCWVMAFRDRDGGWQQVLRWDQYHSCVDVREDAPVVRVLLAAPQYTPGVMPGMTSEEMDALPGGSVVAWGRSMWINQYSTWRSDYMPWWSRLGQTTTLAPMPRRGGGRHLDAADVLSAKSSLLRGARLVWRAPDDIGAAESGRRQDADRAARRS